VAGDNRSRIRIQTGRQRDNHNRSHSRTLRSRIPRILLRIGHR
jgi:hypothetical protein